MGLLDSIPFIGRSQEKHALELIRKHMGISAKASKALATFFGAVGRCDREGAKAALAEVRRHEDDADTFVHSIEELLYSGAFLPVTRSRIVDLVERVDDVADDAKDAAGIAMRLLDRKCDAAVVGHLQRMTDDGIASVDFLVQAYDALQEGRNEDVRRLIQEVRTKEADADRVKGELYTRLYELNDPILLFLVSGIADAVSGISDSAENAADVLAIMLISGLA